ncbi:hypothetical protein Taro_032562, partial [Colocasia esculenta]|nr:hypothetical protein [Colocasia esculenta]
KFSFSAASTSACSPFRPFGNFAASSRSLLLHSSCSLFPSWEMEDMAGVVRSAVLGMTVVMVMVGSSQAHDFYVGGRDGWVQQPRESYMQWAERNRFQVNDSLVFRYRPRDDSVLVVSMQDFDACDTTRPIRKFDNGDTIFQFDRSGPFFFISGVPGRCQAGQKLEVVVMSSRRRPPVPPPPTAAPSPPGTAPSPNQPGATVEMPPGPAPSTEPSGSSADASSRAVALFMGLIGGAFLLW